LTSALIPAMAKVMDESTRPIKGVVFTNPHNPFGQCYPRSTIEECIKFCYQRGIHFISDEVYALSRFDSPDLAEPVPFVSALALDVEALGCDLSRVHTIWSISKDLGSSGFRMVSSTVCC
jgi:gliotoxin/aspirochlorine biosynthesis aminotransferase